ncbi:hypothetical protein P3W45_000902 [Vairimorpha bombi]
MKLVIFLTSVFCSSPLMPPIFKQKGNRFKCEVSFKDTLDVKSYEIMEGPLDAKENDYTPIHKEESQTGLLNSINVDLSDISNPDDEHLYSICVNVVNESDPWYSEAFRYDKRDNKFLLARKYKEDPFYIKYMKYCIGGSVLFGIGIIAFVIKRYMKSKNEQTL